MNKYGLNREDFDSYEEYRRAYLRLFNNSDKGKLARKKYAQSDEGKLTLKKYRQSDKYKLAQKKSQQKYKQSKKGKLTHRVHSAKRRAAELLRTPIWSEEELIRKFYMDVPKGYHVDHIIPLQGETVSGLHVIGNLQYLTASENLSKKNRF